MTYPTESQKRMDVLNEIRLLASSMTQELDRIYNISSPTLPSTSDIAIPKLSFPPSHDITAPIHLLSLPQSTLHAIVQLIDRRVAQVQDQYTAAYRRACIVTSNFSSGQAADDYNSIKQTYEGLYEKNCIPMIQNWVSVVQKEVEKHQRPDAKRFKTEFTPVLDSYFEYNGYPSLAHRSILAERSGMTLRQIEVWFQNHRKRSKQDGKFVRRLDSDIPLKRALSVLPQGAPHSRNRYPTPATPDQELPENQVAHAVIHPTTPGSVLEETMHTSEIRPPHAYPTKRSEQYPDPFPTHNGVYKFPAPVWRRLPATTTIIPTAVDMDDFTRQFHMRLNFVNHSRTQNVTPLKSDVPSFSPWFAPWRVIPPSAPLPALERPHTSTAPSTTLLTSTITLDPFTFVFPQPGGFKGQKQSDITCIVRLPVGPSQSPSSITERIDRSVDALDLERKGFRTCRRALHRHRPSTPRLASPGEIAGRKGTPTSRRGPSGLQAFGSRTSSFTSDTSSSSDDSSSPSTPPPMSIRNLHADPVVESNNLAANFDSFYEVPLSPSSNFTFSKSSCDAQPPSPQLFDFTFTSPINITTEALPSRTFDFTFSKHVPGEPTTLHQNFTPLIFT